MDSWLNRTLPSSEVLRLGSTPEVLKQLDAKDLPVVMNQDVLSKITGGKHDISLDEIKNLPQAVADPIMVFKSVTVPNAFVILTELTDKSGNSVVSAMHMNSILTKIKVRIGLRAKGSNCPSRFSPILTTTLYSQKRILSIHMM